MNKAGTVTNTLVEALSCAGADKEYIRMVLLDMEAESFWQESDQEWIFTGTFADTKNICKYDGVAVYKYENAERPELVYFGLSRQWQGRTSNGKNAFRTIIKTGKQPNNFNYIVIPKMIADDPNPSNWRISVLPTFSTIIAKREEDRLIKANSACYNDPKMAGCG